MKSERINKRGTLHGECFLSIFTVNGGTRSVYYPFIRAEREDAKLLSEPSYRSFLREIKEQRARLKAQTEVADLNLTFGFKFVGGVLNRFSHVLTRKTFGPWGLLYWITNFR